jgi:hypothetical protein
MGGLVAQGVIRRVGLSNVSTEQFLAARQITEIAAVTAPYNIGDRTGAGAAGLVSVPVRVEGSRWGRGVAVDDEHWAVGVFCSG